MAIHFWHVAHRKVGALAQLFAGGNTDGHKLDAEYAQRWSLTLVRRLSSAGRRLALLLNQSLVRR